MAFWASPLGGGLIKGGLDLLGGIFGRRSEKKRAALELHNQRMQFIRLREAAELGGFNPLTVLGANPGAGMVNTQPALSSGEFITRALSTGVDTYFNSKAQERDAERDALEKALMREELKQMQNQGKAAASALAFGYAIPQSNNYSGVTDANAAPGLSASISDSGAGAPGQGVTVGGVTVDENENFSSAQKFEDRYGDLASSAYGLGVMVADAYSTVKPYLPKNPYSVGPGSLARPERNLLRPGRATNLKPHGMRFDPFRGDAYYRP